MGYVFALAGNQNSGKTTLFNQLTGMNQHVGNWPGVTVEQKTGSVYRLKEKELTLVDLPGIYSLSPYTLEETVSRDFLLRQRPDALINIVDAANLERNLYLSLQLVQMEIPTVIALNMMDEVRKRGDTIDVEALSRALGVPIVPICARNGDGLDELLNGALEAAEQGRKPRLFLPAQGEIGEALREIVRLTEKQAGETCLFLQLFTVVSGAAIVHRFFHTGELFVAVLLEAGHHFLKRAGIALAGFPLGVAGTGDRFGGGAGRTFSLGGFAFRAGRGGAGSALGVVARCLGFFDREGDFAVFFHREHFYFNGLSIG